jgi:amino acid adenylation domain-containing protein
MTSPWFPDMVPTKLPPDRLAPDGNHPPVLAMEELALPDGLWDAPEHTDVPRSAVLLSVWCVLLHRHTGGADLLVGAPAPDGTVRPLRHTVDPAATFAQLLERSHELLGEPLAAGTDEIPPVVLDPCAALRREWQAAVTFTVSALGDRPALRVVYHQDRYDRPTATAWLRDCVTLLDDALRNPLSPLAALRMRTVPESSPPWRLPAPEGFTAIPAPGADECPVDRFRSVAAHHGDHLAVTGPSGAYRYAELDRATTAMAHQVRSAASAGSPVAVLCAHDVGAVAAVWAVLKAGCAYVPLDTRHPDGWLTSIVADVDVAAVVCDATLADRATVVARGRPVVTLTGTGPVDAPLPSTAPGEAAYLLHTSGTTGRPKAVVQTRRNVLAHAVTYANRLRLGPHDTLSLLPSITTDAAVMDLFGAHLSGACLHVVEPQASAARVRAALTDVTVLHCTPTVLRHLLDGAGRDEPGSVRAVVLGGEETTHREVEAVLRHLPEGCALVNGLGPTECTLALQHLAGPPDPRRPSLPVGFPVDGVAVRLVDAEGRPSEVFGELEIISDRVAAGYGNDLTAAAFGLTPNGAAGCASLRTGDLARRLPDGSLVFVGRRDRQVKIRGNRVEPDEAQTVLRAHPSVAQAVVEVDRTDTRPRLIGFVTSATAMTADSEELVAYSRRRLPEYAVPTQVVVLDALPIGPTGKVDRAKLPRPPQTAPEDAGGAPRTPREQRIATLWCAVLGLPSCDIHADFLRCGGDSLLVMELLSRVRTEFAVEVPLLDFLRAPTIASLALLVQQPD